MDNNDIFLLSDKNRDYFKRIRAAIFAELHAEGIDTDNDFTVEEDALQRIAQRLNDRKPKINALAAYKKAHKALNGRSFMIERWALETVSIERYSQFFPDCPQDNETDAEAHAAHVAYIDALRAKIESRDKSNPYRGRFAYMNGELVVVYRKWIYQLSDKFGGKFFITDSIERIEDALANAAPMYYIFPIFPESEAYRILEQFDNGDPLYKMQGREKVYDPHPWALDPSPETAEALRNALGLSDYQYISREDYSTLLFLDSFLNAAVAALPSVEITAKGKQPIGSGEPQKRFSYSYIRQGPGLNEYIKMQPCTGDGETGNVNLDDTTGIATISKPGYSIQIPYALLPGLRASAYQLLDAFVKRYTDNGSRNPSVTLNLDEYMTARGLTDRKKAKEQAVADMKVLRFSSVAWEEKHGKKTVSFEFMNLADRGKISRDGVMSFTFGATFHSILSEYPLMPYPDFLQRINSKNNPNSYFFGRKIAEHKRMNAGKPNADIISVETLLSVARSIPSYEKVMQGNRNITARIIEPFERDMDALAPDITWEYCKKSNSPLSEEELSSMNYALFSSLLVHFTLNEYPDQSKLIEKRAAALEAAKQPAKKRKK